MFAAEVRRKRCRSHAPIHPPARHCDAGVVTISTYEEAVTLLGQFTST
jgi:hypothetical protein